MWTRFFQPIDLFVIVPQLELTVFACGILLMDFLLERRYKYISAVTALIGISFSALQLWRMRHLEVVGFNGLLVVDSFFIYFSFLFLLATALVVLMSIKYLDLEEEHEGEYYALVLFATVGMMFMAGGTDLITLFVGLELMAICFYLLTGFLRRDRRSNEAAVKYFLLGVFSSGVLAYGFSLLYGVSGSTNIYRIAEAVRQRGLDDPIVFLAMIAVAAGLFFKVAAVPFHQWAPDVYEGAPTPITAYVSVGSKAASFALLLRLFLVPIGPLRANWMDILAVVAVATMTIGNLAALNQENVKRLLAYSSIGHVGYILLGLVAGNDTGRTGIAIYLFVYAMMTIGAFAVITGMRRTDLVGDRLEDMRGLIFKNPAAALLMLVFLLSLTGIPPTAGFLAKYYIFLSLIETQHYYLAVFAALYVVVALYYYFRIVVMMFLEEAREPGRMTLAPGLVATLAIALVLTLAPGLYPEPLIRFAQSSILPFR
ncbi:MAG: NADH-quinone oxidoreductase subunit N [Acidobacteria bacterium]|nr:NADH-quinone oxidoreductase subunit N [Acidobacteriota bacterium]